MTEREPEGRGPDNFGVGQLSNGEFSVIEDFDKWREERNASEAEDPNDLEDLDDYDKFFTTQDVKGDPNSNEAAFSLAIKRDRFQYLRGVKRIKLIPDKDEWNGEYDFTTGEVTLQAKFSEKPFAEKVQILLHEGGHHGQQIDPETYQAYLDAGLNKITSFLRMANCVHLKDWQKNGIDPVDLSEEVFAESYAHFCLGLEMPEDLLKFWEGRARR